MIKLDGLDLVAAWAGSPSLCALSRTPLRFTSPVRRRNNRHFGCAAPAQAAKAVPALTKTAAVAVSFVLEINYLVLVSGFFGPEPKGKAARLGGTGIEQRGIASDPFMYGSSELSVLDLCRKIMKSVKDDPSRLLTRTAEDFCRFPGVGVAKAATLMAALELGRRAFASGV